MLLDQNELTIYDVDSFLSLLLQEFEKDEIELDFQNVNKIDMSFIQLLVSAQKSANTENKSFIITNVNEEVKKLFTTSACTFLLGGKNEQ